MVIKKIELKDFGQHVHLVEECNVPVVGLMGKNGTGKSTVLEAIEPTSDHGFTRRLPATDPSAP